MAKTTQKWTEERTAQLTSIFPEGTYVTQEDVAKAADALETSARSVSSKLRKLGYDVQLASEVTKGKAFSEEDEAKLKELLTNNQGTFTYGELAEQLGGDFTAKKVQGKVLSMELTDYVRPTPKVEAAKKYTDEEQATFVQMAQAGVCIEEIAEKLGRATNSIRGKALSLLRSGEIDAIPKQKESKAAKAVDALADLGDKVAEMTVAEIAEAIGKTERGVKTMLTRRGISASDYDGAAKAEKKAEK
jgi:hypothetical protein